MILRNIFLIQRQVEFSWVDLHNNDIRSRSIKPRRWFHVFVCLRNSSNKKILMAPLKIHSPEISLLQYILWLWFTPTRPIRDIRLHMKYDMTFHTISSPTTFIYLTTRRRTIYLPIDNRHWLNSLPSHVDFLLIDKTSYQSIKRNEMFG